MLDLMVTDTSEDKWRRNSRKCRNVHQILIGMSKNFDEQINKEAKISIVNVGKC